ncbi:MAG: nucleotidyltransferase family protein [Halanaerobiales bacterium]
MNFDALVVAGGKNDGVLKDFSAKEYESLIEIAGKPMVQHVIDAVEGVEEIKDIVIVGPPELNEVTEKEHNIIKADGGMVNNVKRGIEVLDDKSYILIITSDVPLVSPEIIKEFIHRCKEEMKYDLFYPIISKKINLKKYPEVERTYVHLKEGVFTGGNLLLVSPDIIQGPLEWYNKILSLRKKPLKMSKMLGFKFIIKLIFRRLSISELEERVSEIIGYDCKALFFDYPEIGFDVDKPSDLKMMREKYLKS